MYDGCSDIRAAIKEGDSSKGSGTIDTLADDITALFPTSVATKVYKDNTTEELGMVQYASTATAIASTISTNSIPSGKTAIAFILPGTTVTVSADTFKNNTAIQYINLENVKTIGNTAFGGTSNLNIDLNLPNLTSIGTLAFLQSGITKITSLGNITSIPNDTSGTNGGCFARSLSLKEVILPDTLTMLGNYAFYNCTALEKVVFPNHPISFGNGDYGQRGQFYNCTKLSDIGQPQISRFSGYHSFKNCSSLVTADFSLSTFTTTYNPDSYVNGTFHSCTKLQSVILPLTCAIIGAGSFYGCSALTSVTGWDNVTNIYTRAFQNSKVAGQLHLDDLRTVASYAFTGCHLTSIILPALVATAGTSNTSNSGSFSNNKSLTYAEFGPNCTTIGYRTFQNCSALKTFVCRATTPPTLQTNVFNSTNSALKIYVPYSSDNSILNAYKAASNWSAQASKIYSLDENGEIPT